jgi:hypothetical protein
VPDAATRNPVLCGRGDRCLSPMTSVACTLRSGAHIAGLRRCTVELASPRTLDDAATKYRMKRRLGCRQGAGSSRRCPRWTAGAVRGAMHAGTCRGHSVSCAVPSLVCKPCCMPKSRRGIGDSKAKAHARQRERTERAAAERAAVAARQAASVRLGGGATSGLQRLGELSARLERLHSGESDILRERDQLIDDLRLLDTSWNLIALRSGISRQALSKRAR